MSAASWIETATRNFGEASGLELEINLESQGKGTAAAIIHSGANTYTFHCEVLGETRTHVINSLKRLIPKKNQLFLIRYLSAENRKALRKEGINFLDASGNCFIRTADLLVSVEGQKVAAQREPEIRGILNHKTGIKLVYALLDNPKLLEKPYREMAGKAGIALGSVGSQIKLLEEEGFIRENASGKKELARIGELTDKWADAYTTKLRPGLIKSWLRPLNQQDFDRTWIMQHIPQTSWGGEPGANILDNYLRPEKFTLYSTEKISALMKSLTAVPDARGSIEIIEPFWDMGVDERTVPPLIIYADLLQTGDDRSREAAERIKEMYLEGRGEG